MKGSKILVFTFAIKFYLWLFKNSLAFDLMIRLRKPQIEKKSLEALAAGAGMR